MPITPEETLAIFEQTGAYLTGHFRLTSGLHTSEYLQCALVLQHPEFAERLGRELAMTIGRTLADEPNFVIAPAMGGLVIGHEVARAFGVRFIFAERDGSSGTMQLRRGFTIEPGTRAIVIEDVITTGGSTREVGDIVNTMGARPIAAGSIIDRSGGIADVGAPRVALATLSVKTWAEDSCPLCRDGVPVVKPGSRSVG